MGLKVYQPERKDLLINTEWGIPNEQLSKEEAKSRNLVFFQGRWVTSEEKKRLKREHLAYRWILNISGLFIIFVPLIVLLYSLTLLPALIGREWTSLMPLIIPVLVCALSIRIGFGLRQYKRWARTVVMLFSLVVWILILGHVLGSFKVGSFDELSLPEVVGILMVAAIWFLLVGAVPFYYLYNRTAQKIFHPPNEQQPTAHGSKFPHKEPQ